MASNCVVLNLHAIINSSRVNGPGSRLVVFFQGCMRACPGCFNPETHPFGPNKAYTAGDLFARHLVRPVEGLTVSGGEPFMQPEGLLELLKGAKERGLSTVVYTGFAFEELERDARASECLGHMDVLVDGPYDSSRPEPTLLARGSTNQRILLLSARYSLEDFVMPAKAELTIGRDGAVTGTGFGRVLGGPVV